MSERGITPRPDDDRNGQDVEGHSAADPYVAAIRQALLDRLEGLQSVLDELIGRQLGGGGHGAVGSDDDAVVPPELLNVDAASHALLRELSLYPKQMKAVIERRLSRNSRPTKQARNLRRLSRNVVDATSLIEDWFSGSDTGDAVPSALVDAVQHRLTETGLSGKHAIVTSGPPDRLETILTDARAKIFAPIDQAYISNEPDSEHRLSSEQGDSAVTYAVFRVPAHEARSPRWWPVVLGHEVTHHWLRARNPAVAPQSTSDESEPIESFSGSDEDRSPQDQFYALRIVNIDDAFPVQQMEEILRQEAKVARPPSTPPGTGREFDDELQTTTIDTTSVTSRIQIANGWVEEVLCDLAMVRRFGPAAVVALIQYLIAVDNYAVRSVSHPSGYFRVERMLHYLGPHVPDLFKPLLETWKDALEAHHLAPEPPWINLISQFIRDHATELEETVNAWPGERYNMADVSRQEAVVLALRQISIGLPPYPARPHEFPSWLPFENEPEFPVKHPPADEPIVSPTTADIINAGWLAVVRRQLGDPNFNEHLPVDKLLLKSVETEQLRERLGQAEFYVAAKPPEPAEPVQADRKLGQSQWTDGSVLGADAIRDRLDQKNPWRRIIVTPRWEQDVSGASIDLRLSNRFIIFQRTAIASFNVQKGHNARAVQRLVERPFTSPFVLHPGEVVLASALEYIALPEDIAAQVITRSSYGRLGLITATAVQVHPLYRGCLTLELVNLGTVPMTLHPGERVAQLVFQTVRVPVRHEAPSPSEVFRGSFVCPTGPEFPAVKADELMTHLSSLSN